MPSTRDCGDPHTARTEWASPADMRYVQVGADRVRLRVGSVSQSHGFELVKREQHHAQQHQSVSESRDLRLAIGARTVVNRDFDDFQTALCCTKDQIKVSEGVE